MRRAILRNKAVHPYNARTGTLYFDVATGLLHATKYRISGSAAADSASLVMLFGDYKRFDGVLIATTMTLGAPQGQNVVTRTTHIDHAVIDTARFTPAAAVLSLILKRP